jgi:biopolymer transport protein TolQ
MTPDHAEKINPLTLMRDASGVVLVVLVLLVIASFLVWVIWALKSLQLGRMRSAHEKFELAASQVHSARDLVGLALQHVSAPGARVVVELAKRHGQPRLSAELLMSVAKRALVAERQRAEALMPMLASIASASPFVGLFGTVWGIMEAFLKIGIAKSASLPVVAPAIGEALIATAVGLVAAIPATVAYNFVERKIGDLLSEVEASAETWVETLAGEAGSDPLGASRKQPSTRMHVPAE